MRFFRRDGAIGLERKEAKEEEAARRRGEVGRSEAEGSIAAVDGDVTGAAIARHAGDDAAWVAP